MKIKDDDLFLDFPDIFTLSSEDKDISPIVKTAVFAFIGLCFSQLDALGNMSPFTTAFAASVDFTYSFPVFIAGTVGYFISRSPLQALKYVLACALVCLVRLFLNKRKKHLDTDKFNCVSVFLCLLLSGLIFLAFSGMNITAVFLLICESLLGLCSTVFFTLSLRTPSIKTGIANLPIKNTASTVISMGILLMCMSGFNIEGLSPARILSAVFVMFLSLYKGCSGGAISGVITGCALCIAPSDRFLFPCFALSGLVAGLFSSFGQIITATAYGLSFSLVCLISEPTGNSLICLVEAALAAAGFMLIPARHITAFQDFLLKRGVPYDGEISSQVSSQLFAASQSIYEVSAVVSQVSEKLDSIINPEVNRLFAQLQHRVCTCCDNKSKCWNKMFDSTASDILCLAGIEKSPSGRLPLEKRCLRRELLINEIEIGLTEYTNNMAMKMKVREMRKVLTDQFTAMGDFLSETAKKAQCSRITDTARSVATKTALNDAGIYTDALTFYTDSDGRVTIEINIIDRAFETDRKKLKNIIEFLCKKQFDEPEFSVTEIKTTITFTEKASFQVLFGSSQKPLKKGSLCGDSVCFITCPDGNKAALISDGMGTGSRAAIDSYMTSQITEKLISAGFSVPCAIKAVNSAMIMKSTDESIASVDCLTVNTFSGEGVFYKSGAAISFMRRGNNIHIVSASSLPIGIIRNISPSQEKFRLESGDIVLLVSDGVTANDCSWINDELLSWSTNNMDDLASHIASLALLRSDKASRDDITAVAVKISKAQ